MKTQKPSLKKTLNYDHIDKSSPSAAKNKLIMLKIWNRDVLANYDFPLDRKLKSVSQSSAKFLKKKKIPNIGFSPIINTVRSMRIMGRNLKYYTTSVMGTFVLWYFEIREKLLRFEDIEYTY